MGRPVLIVLANSHWKLQSYTRVFGMIIRKILLGRIEVRKFRLKKIADEIYVYYHLSLELEGI